MIVLTLRPIIVATITTYFKRMKALIFLIYIFLIADYQVSAQNDSLTLVNVKWECRNLINGKGAVWKNHHFTRNELFHSNQNINIIELSSRFRKIKLAIACSDSLEKTSQLSRKRNAIAGINGSFFKMRGADPDDHKNLTSVPLSSPSKLEHNRSVEYLRVNDILITENYFKDKDVTRQPRGVLSISKKGICVLKEDTAVSNWERTLPGSDVIASGPVLLSSGCETTISGDSFCNKRHPRTAVGKRADGTILILVVDGRFPESNGMSIYELQKTMRWLGCVDAINLDGGGSSTLYIKGQSFDGVVNYPSDNKKFDHAGEREVANAILLLPK
jgi:exopolysaccharide biosynthesis protein